MRQLLMIGAWLVGALAVETVASEPLHVRIDRQIEAAAGDLPRAPVVDDDGFARRVYLDLVGRIPTIQELRHFREDTASDKRERLIDALLTSPEAALRLADWLHVVLMERRGDHPEWQAFLRESTQQRRSWEAIAKAILKPDAEDPTLRGAAFFMTQRLVSEGAMAAIDTPGLTRDVGRLFAGVDLQCAQCHDDLYVDDYLQQDFQGLHVVFEHVVSRRDTDYPAVAETLLNQPHEFVSVFAGGPATTGVRVPGAGELPIPEYDEDEAYLVAPDRRKKILGVPKFSPLATLAEHLATSNNRAFAQSMANRLWAKMMGRGLVEPLDAFHSDNPPSDPELLDLLTDAFIASDFDLPTILGELARTKTYQRSSRLAGEQPPPERFLVAQQRRLGPEQLLASTLVASGKVRPEAESPELPHAVTIGDEHKGLRALFLKTFANPPKEPELEFEPSVKSALFLMHEPRVLKLLANSSGSVVGEALALDDREAMVAHLFEAILSRPPTDDDRREALAFLEEAADLDRAVQNLAWALVASTEFCTNH